jgi:hypothetical protein
MSQRPFSLRHRYFCMETFTPGLGTIALTSLIAIPFIVYAIGWLAARVTRRRQ